MTRKAVFYKPARSKKVYVPTPAPEAAATDEPEELLVKGEPAGSKLEWNVAQALDIMELEYDYQYSVHGGHRLLGGQVIDFYVYTPGQPTPLLVHGRYWHTGEKNDELDTYRLKRMLRNRVRDPLVIWEEDCLTVDLALAFLRQNLNVG